MGSGNGARVLVAPLLAAALALGACDPKKNPAWTLGGEPGLLFTIKQYYELNALEEGGSCSAPLLDGVTRSRVVEEEPDRFVVDLGYYYRDMIRDGDDCQLPNAPCLALRECQGFAERRFVVGKQADRLRVLEMTGPRKGRVRQP